MQNSTFLETIPAAMVLILTLVIAWVGSQLVKVVITVRFVHFYVLYAFGPMEDSDYRLLSDEAKKKKFANYCALMNGTDPNTMLQISVISHPITEQIFETDFAFDLPAGEELEGHRKEFNDILKRKCLPGTGGGIIADKLLTITIKAPNLPTAQHQLQQQIEQYTKALHGVSGDCRVLNAAERLAYFKHILRP